LPGLVPLPPKPLILNEILEKMHEEMTLKMGVNQTSNLLLFEDLRGLATYIVPSYLFPF